MKSFRARHWLFLMLTLALVGLACGQSGGEATPTSPPAPTQAPAALEPTPVPPTPTPEVAGPVTGLESVQSAVIQIVAQGSFVDPEVGAVFNAAGSGSGFIIDPSGIAVTNNHVVTGAAFLQVYVAGEQQPRNARVLGVSECSDLAVIDIDGDDFPYLTWYEGDISVGLDVFAAGFPLGDPEFTLTRGIISKARAGGDTGWASVDSVVEHDATINPGNSGGPLVTSDGLVVGVNYAGASQVSQYFAIARQEALRVIDQLQTETDVTSIGVNGTVVNDGDGLSGIWVSSVESGSPADRAGVKGGDIIVSLEGLILGTDGTMADYCDILRSRRAEDVMKIEVVRFATQEYLEGQLNGTPLALSFSFAQALDSQVGGDSGAGVAYDYTTISDDTGLLLVEVPTAWSDVNGSSWISNDEEIGLAVSAAPDLEAWNAGWDTPGVFFGASEQLIETFDENALLDAFDFSDSCEYNGRSPYEDPLYTGFYDVWANCGGLGSSYITVAATPADRAFIIFVGVVVVSQADLEALDRVLDTFIVDVQ